MNNLYETEEWKSLPPTERVYLLPTIEDIRPGCLVNTKRISKISDLEYCLNQKGLKSYKNGNSWLVSKNETLLEEAARKWESFSIAQSHYGIDKEVDEIVKQIEKDYHKFIGKFFGYPKCCIKNFTKTDLKGRFPNRKWYKKAGKALLKEKYNNLFDYVLHIPCGPGCKKSLELAEKIKECLETHDLEAAETLRKTNRTSVEGAAKKCTTT